MSKEVTHEGIVKEIDGNTLYVSVIAKSACISCQVKGACSVSDISEKIVEVNRYGVDFELGEKVDVSLKESLGVRALIIGYMIPFFLVLLMMIVGTAFYENELMVGLVSLTVLVPYYFVLFLLRDRLKKRFSFFVHKR